LSHENGFVDFYEILQVNPRADAETISRVFRHLAKRYHPDNPVSGDRSRFDALTEAHEILTNPEKRAAYDLNYEDGVSSRLGLLDEAIGCGSYDEDRALRERLLSLLYVQRRRDVDQPAIGEVDLELTLDCPREHLAFHIWYLKEKSWVERTDRGFAITALGIDEVESSRLRLRKDRLLAERSESSRGADSCLPSGRPEGGGAEPGR
jgi:curved DNA-binding protein CbpA